jgi:hypothetical protein
MKEREHHEKVEKSSPSRTEKKEEFRSEGPGGEVEKTTRHEVTRKDEFGEPVTTRETIKTERES